MGTKRLLFVALLAAGLLIAWWLSTRRAAAPALDSAASSAPERSSGQAPPAPAPDPLDDSAETRAKRPSAPESAEDERTAVAERELVVVVVDPEQRPVPRATVVVHRGDTLLASGATDERGRVRLGELEGRAAYVLGAPGWGLARGELELGTGERTISLAERAILRGRALVDGSAPPPFAIHWRTQRDDPEFDLPNAVLQRISSAEHPFASATTSTLADGTFELRGLAPERGGTLFWRAPYFRRGVEDLNGGSALKLDAPRDDVSLDLVSGLELRLRVVDGDGKPLPKAQVRIELGSGTPANPVGAASASRVRGETQGLDRPINGTTDDQGRFSRAFRQVVPATCRIGIAARDSDAWREYSPVPPTPFRGLWDLGDLEAGVERVVSVCVQDVESRPIEGAEIRARLGRGARAPIRSDAVGQATISLVAETCELTVAAFSYESEVVSVPEGAREVVATLRRGATLEFVLADRSRSTVGLTLELAGPDPMFAARSTSGDRADLVMREFENPNASRSSGDGRATLVLRSEPNLRWRVTRLVPGNPLVAKLRGGGNLLATIEIPPLAPEEHRLVVCPIDAEPRSLLLRVLSPEGTPVPKARVATFEAGDVQTIAARPVDERGELALDWLTGDRFECVVLADGYPRKSVELQPIPTGTQDVRLERSDTCSIELVQSDGRVFAGPVSFNLVGFGGPQVESSSPAPGVHELHDLTRGDVWIGIHGAFGHLWRSIRVGGGRNRVVVDGAGTIDVAIHGRARPYDGEWGLELALPGAERGFAFTAFWAEPESPWPASFTALGPGRYELWLLHARTPLARGFERIGGPTEVLIEAGNPRVSVALRLED